MKPFPKRYLGGDVYAECLGHSLVLTAESNGPVQGSTEIHTVVIGAEYMRQLLKALADAEVIPHMPGL